MGKRKRLARRGKRISIAVTLGMFAAVLAEELRKPKAERHWVGKIAGIVPYDLRPPTIDRVRRALWSPDEPKIFMPRAFGIGWDVNLGRIYRLLTHH